MEMTEAEQQESLRELRADLDAVDRILLNALLMRHHCTSRIGAVKEARAIPVMQSGRVRLVLERATDFALEHGLNPVALQDVFSTLIADACRAEEGQGGTAAGPARERIAALVADIETGKAGGVNGRAHTAH